MLGPGATEAVALVAAYLIAVVATPAGISGAVLLLPFQVSVLGTPSPAVTPPTCSTTWSQPQARCTGGIYGIGGGSILAPILVGILVVAIAARYLWAGLS